MYQSDYMKDLSGGWVSITPVTLHDQKAFAVTLYQMALALNDNRYLERPAHICLGIYLYQEVEQNPDTFDFAALLAQTDIITVRHTDRPPPCCLSHWCACSDEWVLTDCCVAAVLLGCSVDAVSPSDLVRRPPATRHAVQ